jgi:hypothetical protein
MLVAQTYFPAIDGTAVLIQHLAEQSAARGDEVHVITTDALGPAGFRTRHLARTTAAHKSHRGCGSSFATSTALKPLHIMGARR